MSKKPVAALSAGLVAVKGQAAAPAGAEAAPPRTPAIAEPKAPKTKSEALLPLNFRIGASFRREFKTYAATHDLKLNELLKLSFEAYRKQRE
jgi:hypothetical protein